MTLMQYPSTLLLHWYYGKGCAFPLTWYPGVTAGVNLDSIMATLQNSTTTSALHQCSITCNVQQGREYCIMDYKTIFLALSAFAYMNEIDMNGDVFVMAYTTFFAMCLTGK